MQRRMGREREPLENQERKLWQEEDKEIVGHGHMLKLREG